MSITPAPTPLGFFHCYHQGICEIIVLVLEYLSFFHLTSSKQLLLRIYTSSWNISQHWMADGCWFFRSHSHALITGSKLLTLKIDFQNQATCDLSSFGGKTTSCGIGHHLRETINGLLGSQPQTSKHEYHYISQRKSVGNCV